MSELQLLHIIEERSKSVDRRVHVAEVPFVRRHLAARMQIGLGQHQIELLLSKVTVDHAQGNGVNRKVPGGIPRIFPSVRHGEDVVVNHMEPATVSYELATAAQGVCLMLSK